IAKGNAKKLKAKVNFVQSDMFSNIKGKYNLIVCNPPYIESAEIASLPENVKREPVIALDGGADGLDFYRILAEKSCEFLAKDGKIIMEIGYNQGESVKNLFEGKFDGIEVLKDYSGLDRIVIAYLKK
ncbi:MAG: HemK/PrmC family methyltransferase, partial [Clostridia bacterium]